MSDGIDREPIVDNSYEHKYLNTFQIGDSYVGVWKIEDVSVKTAKNNKKYIEYLLKDKSDVVKAFFFNEDSPVNKGDYACIDLQCQEYQSSKTFKVITVMPNEGEEATPINKSYYFDSFDEDFLTKKLDIEVEILKNTNTYVYEIVRFVFNCKNPSYNGFPSNSPVYAKHGGALAHTVSLVELATSMAKSYGLNDNEASVLIGSLMILKSRAMDCFERIGEGEYKSSPVLHLYGVDFCSISYFLSKMRSQDVADFSDNHMKYMDRMLHCMTANEISENKPATKEAFLFNKIVYNDALLRSFMASFDKSKVEGKQFSVKDSDWKREFLIEELPSYVEAVEPPTV